MLDILMRRCCKCKQLKPATQEYFHRDHNQKDGCEPRCKECRKIPPSITSIPPGFKECTRCKQILPATLDYFFKQLVYLTGTCKTCRRIANSKPEVRQKNTDYKRNWTRSHPNNVKAMHDIRRARKRAISGSYTAQDIQAQYERQKGKCYYCHKKLGKGINAYQVDHVIPVTREGSSNDPSNLVVACRSCNCSKNNKLPHEWAQGGRLM